MRRLGYFSWRREWPAGAAIAAVLTAAYIAAMPPGASFEDAGMIAAACYNFEFLHPPGYPLYSLLCAPFARLADIAAFRPIQAAALFSAIAAAGACVLFYEIARRFAAQKMIALAAALTLGLGARFWSQAIIPETYALNALLTAATFAATLRVIRAPHRRRWLLLFLLCGLGLANHWPLYASVAPAFVLFLAGARRFPDGKTAAAGAAVFIAGLSPYLHLLLRPHWGGEMISLFAPPQDLGEMFSYASREIYAAADTKRIADGGQCVQSALWTLRLLANEYTFLGGAMAAVGAAMFARRRPLLWTFAVLYGAASAPLLSGYLCLNADGDETAKTILAAYPLPAMLFVMTGMVAALNCLRAPGNVFAAAILAAATGAYNWAENDRRGEYFAEHYAAAVLDSLPQNAAFVVGDDWSYPLFYLHHSEGARSDLMLVGNDSAAQKAAAGRRLFVAAADWHGGNARDWGMVQELRPAVAAQKSPIPPPLIRFYRRLPEWRTAFESDTRQFDHAAVRRALMAAGRALTADGMAGELTAEAEAARKVVMQTPEGLFGRMEALLRMGAPSAAVRDSLAGLRRMRDSFPDSWRGRLLHIEGVLDWLAGQKRSAGEKWRESLILDSSADNPALIDLLHLFAAEQEWRQYAHLRLRHRKAKNPALDESDAACIAAAICETAQ